MLQIKNALPKLQVFNAKPLDKDTKNDKGDIADDAHDFSLDHVSQNDDDHLEAADERKSGKKRKKTVDISEEAGVLDKENTGDRKDNGDREKDKLIGTVDLDTKSKSSKKKKRKDEKPLDKALPVEENVNGIEKKKKNQKNEKQSQFDIIDDPETSFLDLFNIQDEHSLNHSGGEMKLKNKVPKDLKPLGSIESSPVKHKSVKMHNTESLSPPITEIGMGGQSTWDD